MFRFNKLKMSSGLGESPDRRWEPASLLGALASGPGWPGGIPGPTV